MRYGLDRLRFGVNYTPPGRWWHCWNDFSADDVARDLDAIAALGADHVRIMVLWPYFHPNPTFVSPAHLDRLETLMTLAEPRGLDVCVSAFVGWLSGYRFVPPFVNDATFYGSTEAVTAQKLLLRELAARLRGFDNFLGFDLGNEINCCWQSALPGGGDQWHTDMLRFAGEIAPGRVHVNGVDHQPWFHPTTFTPRALASSPDVITLHAWTSFTGAIARSCGDVFGEPSIRLLEAMAALARSYAGDAAKPVWIQEYGMSEAWAAKNDVPRFLEEATLHGLRGGVHWFTWWSSHDLARDMKFDELEYSLGLIGRDQKLKPAGEAFKTIAGEYAGRTIERARRDTQPPPDLTDDATWQWLGDWLASHPAR